MAEPLVKSEELLRAFEEYDREIILNNISIGCMIGIVLVPAGSLLDYYVYRPNFLYFLKLRLLGSLLISLFWAIVTTPFGRKHPRQFGVLLAFIPALVNSCTIYATNGADSTYYVGYILVFLVVSLVLHWTFLESSIVVTVVTLMYVCACALHGNAFTFNLLNNLFFLILTGIIVATGSYFYSKTRFREFAYQYQLNKSKQELETSNTKLSEQNIALENANREIKEAEILLVQAEKMSSLGRFSAGLMHDILNPLNYARTGTFTLRKKSRDLSPELRAEFDETLTDIEDGLKRVDHIVSDLRSFTHPGGQTPESVGLADIFKTSLRFVSSELKEKNISLELNLLPDQKIWIGRNQSILVLVNLLENAIDALAEKEFPPSEQPVIQITSRTQSDHSLIFIRDNGPGIDANILHRIFDPFFTTKDVGKGTGLGLSICFGIIRGYGGNLTVNSEPGKFCEFTLDLPTNEAAAQSSLKNAD